MTASESGRRAGNRAISGTGGRVEGTHSCNCAFCTPGDQYRSAWSSDSSCGWYDLRVGKGLCGLLHWLRTGERTGLLCGATARSSTGELYSRTESRELADSEDQFDASGVCSGTGMYGAGRSEWCDPIYCGTCRYHDAWLCDGGRCNRVAAVCNELPLWIFHYSRTVCSSHHRICHTARHHRSDQLEKRSPAW